MKFYPNEPVYYYRKNRDGSFDTFPATVVAMGSGKVRIIYESFEGCKLTWVKPSSLEPQIA